MPHFRCTPALLLSLPLLVVEVLGAPTVWAAASPPAPDGGPGPAVPLATAYTHLTVIDGSGAPAQADMAIVVEGEHIKDILPASTWARHPQPGIRTVDLKGQFALPGLIDTHQHLGTVPNRRAAEAQTLRLIYGGVTAVRDMAGDTRFLGELAREARLGELPAPDIYYSALMAGPAFFVDPRTQSSARGAEAGHVPWMQAITDHTDMVTAVAMARGTGASGIKIYADVPPAEVKRIVDEAHRQGIPVWAHAAIFPTTPGEGIAAGIDSISHAHLLVYAFNVPPESGVEAKPKMHLDQLRSDTTVLPALYAEMRRRGTILDATVGVAFSGDKKAPPDRPKRAPVAVQIARAAHQAGVELSVGTDFVAPAESAYSAEQQEMELLVSEVGMTPAEVIHAATEVGARALHLEAEMGSLAPGKLANIVIVPRNPLDDIHALSEIELTIKRGHEFPRADYRQPDAKVLAEEF